MDQHESTATRILGVFAHPDDEVFCAGGLLARYCAMGAEAMVVSLTRGEAGQIRDARVATRRTLGTRREQELSASCRCLGVQHARCLDYGDGQLTDLPPEVLVCQVADIIRDFRPDVIVTFDETGAYGHPDHITVSRITTAACAQCGDADILPQSAASGLTPHLPARLYHSYFPRNDRFLFQLLVEWLAAMDTKFRGSDDFVRSLMLFAEESSMLGYAADHIDVAWYPDGFYVIEQGEPATALYLILSGEIDVIREDQAGEGVHVARLGPGAFLGETGLAHGTPRNAHCVAASTVTCLVFSPAEPLAFAGRGDQARYLAQSIDAATKVPTHAATARIDVREYVPTKLAAMAAHRSQYPLTPDIFPRTLVEELLRYEYFVPILPYLDPQTELFPMPGARQRSLHARRTQELELRRLEAHRRR